MNPVHQVRVYGKCQKSQLLFRRNPKTTRYRLLHLRKRGSSPTCQTNTKCASPLSPAEQNLPLKSKQICIASQRQSRYIKQQRQSFKETSISIRIMIILPENSALQDETYNIWFSRFHSYLDRSPCR